MTSHRPHRSALSARQVPHQNPAGDLVVPADLGEVVLLPRLWDFELAAADGAGLTLDSPLGIAAVVTWTEDHALRVQSVGESALACGGAAVRTAS